MEDHMQFHAEVSLERLLAQGQLIGHAGLDLGQRQCDHKQHGGQRKPIEKERFLQHGRHPRAEAFMANPFSEKPCGF
ncbi:MAG: hypothetical protein BWZ10_02249 [candidate division BRC1 bacterium ADurb.BinA364]|nr:MAG: hypothetical protein BWZ10_02249 [candidate division BRC1 bacterium ADurb.BinA364]